MSRRDAALEQHRAGRCRRPLALRGLEGARHLAEEHGALDVALQRKGDEGQRPHDGEGVGGPQVDARAALGPAVPVLGAAVEAARGGAARLEGDGAEDDEDDDREAVV